MKRQFTMLAHTYNPTKHSILGWWMSEKLDGQRCLWDGGASRGKYNTEIPWANQNSTAICTGLWSRLGNIIHAPKYWLDALPNFPLDGELYSKELSRQELRSIVSRHEPITYMWDKVQYHVFDVPNYSFLEGGIIDIPNCFIEINGIQAAKHVDKFPRPEKLKVIYPLYFNSTEFASFIHPVKQIPICPNMDVDYELQYITKVGGEGLMFRNPDSVWCPYRTHDLLKYKLVEIDEVKVTGWTRGEGKYNDMMGSLEVEWRGKHFNISGFTDEERELDNEGPVHFDFGQTIKFSYRGLTDDGIPVEARYYRE